jgi:asparagine synthase (glutamine-hydrolysing)
LDKCNQTIEGQKPEIKKIVLLHHFLLFTMCGICGFYSTSGVFSGNDLEMMSSSLSHRGPDANGVFLNGNVGLGHKRLSIIDLSNTANQPMYSHNDRFVMVYNGEVYNFKEIAEECKLKYPDFRLKTSSDSEVILEAFVLWGADFVNKLNGMFAIVIYDKLEDLVYVFRDRVGIKPLYYYWDNQNFAFASELKALKTSNFINKNISLNPIAINKYLHLGYIPEPHSIYKNIYKFPAGNFAVIKGFNLNIIKYWSIEDKITPYVLNDEQEAVEQLKKLLVSSVKYRMISDVPFGTFLSGGIDSSLITAIAQSLSTEPVNTFNIRFIDAKYDESHYAKAIAGFIGTRHHEYTVTEKDAIDLIPNLLGIYDEPFADSSAIPTLLVSKMAKQNVTMTLSGDGGDELFMGYGAYKWAQRLNNPIISVARRPVRSILSGMNDKYRRASHLFEKVSKDQLASHIFSQEQYLFSRNEIASILKPEFYCEFKLDERSVLRRQLSHAENQSLFDFKYYLKDDLLVKVDRASMHYSLETRVPLLDFRIVEFAYNLSCNLKYRKGTTKYLLKEVLYEYLPPGFFDRPKWGFSIPLKNWLDKDLRYLIGDYLSESAIKKTGILDEKTVTSIIELYRNNDRKFLYNRLWELIVLQNFLLR